MSNALKDISRLGSMSGPRYSENYDANGNMESGPGSTLEWTSYNYPACIRTGP